MPRDVMCTFILAICSTNGQLVTVVVAVVGVVVIAVAGTGTVVVAVVLCRCQPPCRHIRIYMHAGHRSPAALVLNVV